MIIKISKVPTLTLETVKQISVSIAGAAQFKEEVEVQAQVYLLVRYQYIV
jgi:hypothetical protein